MATKKAAKKAAAKRAPVRDERGRYQRAHGEEAGQEPGGGAAKEKKERPVRCIHQHADVELRRAFPNICKTFLDKAEDGSVQHARTILKLAEQDEKKTAKRRSGATLSGMLLAELKRRQDEREQLSSDVTVRELQGETTETAAAGGATSEDAEKL